MKTKHVLAGLMLLATAIALVAFNAPERKAFTPKGCVFRTVMGEESSADFAKYKTPERVVTSIERGLAWVAEAQNKNGGWGAGSHYRQQEMNPHAVATDPATTAMVSMALLRTGNNLQQGRYSPQLKRALEYLLNAVETSPIQSHNITNITGTQIQTKLGANIDVVLTSQFLSNMLAEQNISAALRQRILRAQEICVQKIQLAQSADGSIAGSGWAGVLQSSFATNALEAAEANGVKIDKKKLEKAREFQKSNYNAQTGEVNTDMGAGVVLYSVSGSARASAKEARRVEESMEKAKSEGKIAKDAAPSAENLMKLGYSRDEAVRYNTSYEVYQSAKVQAQRDDVLDGFGNNGGEEFLSYLQTGESMVINKDNSWQTWYDNTSGRILKIQNNDGSWNGHHCITSPVFCTASCVLILSIQNDIDKLHQVGR